MSFNIINGVNLNIFPYQVRSRKEKTKEFFKKCVDAGASVVYGDNKMGLRSSISEKISNYNLINNIVDPKEVEAVVNPYGIEMDLSKNYKNYPLINSYMNLLVGEERERMFNPMVVLTSPDLVNQKLDAMTSFMNKVMVQELTAPIIAGNKPGQQPTDQQQKQIQEVLQKNAKWFKFNYRDKRERMAEQVLQYGIMKNHTDDLFSRTFEDLLIAGEEIAVVEIVAGEPIIRRGDPINFYTIRNGASYRIEDSDIIVEFGYIPIGQAVDEYHDELTRAQIKKLESGYQEYKGATRMFTRQLKYKDIDLSQWLEGNGGIGEVINANARLSDMFSMYFDAEGNVRRIRVMWKGKRKLGVLEFFDEDGDLQKKYIDEDYPLSPDEEKSVHWIWINEWYEGTLIGEDMYVKMGPSDIQMRSMVNPSECNPGIVGTIFGTPGMPSKSFVSMAKQYQLMYNYFMKKLWDELRTYKGSIAKISTALIPAGWSMDQFLYYIDQIKVIFEDPFNVGKEGAAMGKLAGNMNQPSSNVKIGDPEVITQLVSILNFIENRLADITGITPQRKGAVENRETYRGVERAVTQSSLNTAKYYYVHNEFKLKALTAYLEAAKLAWRDQEFKRQYILDDMSQAVLEFDGKLFAESEYGVFVSSSNSDHEMMQTLRSLSQAFLQNGGSMAMVADLYRTKDPASLQRKLEAYEEELKNQSAQQAQMNAEAAQKQMEAELQMAQEKIDLARENNIRDNDTQLQIALASVEEKLAAPNMNEAERAKLLLEQGKLTEEIRKNKEDEAIRRAELKAKPTNKK